MGLLEEIKFLKGENGRVRIIAPEGYLVLSETLEDLGRRMSAWETVQMALGVDGVARTVVAADGYAIIIDSEMVRFSNQFDETDFVELNKREATRIINAYLAALI